MKYFNNIKSFSDLKKQYRNLVLNNHPDKGGTTEMMQEINKEFEQLYNVWKDRKETEDNTGYSNDYEGATAHEYADNVYNEYGWTGSRRDRYYSRDELKKIFIKWLKETYKNCTFSINIGGYNSIRVCLLKADFNPFIGDIKLKYSFSRYKIDDDPELNERAKDMFNNIHNFCMSYNYDHSDVYTDYFDVGFYFDIGIGSGKTPFKVEIPKSRRTSGAADPEFKYKEGPAHRAIKKVLGRQYFGELDNNIYKSVSGLFLGEDYIYNNKVFFNPLNYAAPTTQKKKIEKLLNVGIITKAYGEKIQFVGYTPEIEKALAEEDRAKDEAFKLWKEEQAKESDKTAGKSDKESTPYGDTEKSLIFIKALAALLDAVQETITEHPEPEDKQPAPEDIAKVLELFPDLLDAVCEILKTGTHEEKDIPEETHQKRQEERTPADNAIYNSVCSSAILTGEYRAARQEIKQAIKRYRFTIPQLKYLVYLLNTHPGINQANRKKAA